MATIRSIYSTLEIHFGVLSSLSISSTVIALTAAFTPGRSSRTLLEMADDDYDDTVSDAATTGRSTETKTSRIVYHKSPLLPPRDGEYKPKTALILLNTPFGGYGEDADDDGCWAPSPLLHQFWELADFRVCADGGANRLYSSTSSMTSMEQHWDSIRPSVREFYANKGVAIVGNPDQDSNDLEKALDAAIHGEPKCERCIVYGAFGGRFDQEMASFQALFKWRQAAATDQMEDKSPEEHQKIHACPSIWLYDDHTTAFLLHSDCENRIELALPSAVVSLTTASDSRPVAVAVAVAVAEGPTCGLIPLSEPCQSVTTTGFQWNLSAQPTAFGSLVSTSNRIIVTQPNDFVTVVASSPLVFTAEVQCGRIKPKQKHHHQP
jgi:thiamine pyrophosphokinase